MANGLTDLKFVGIGLMPEGKGQNDQTNARVAGEPLCDGCDGPMMEHACKLVCTNCGFRRDCSDA